MLFVMDIERQREGTLHLDRQGAITCYKNLYLRNRNIGGLRHAVKIISIIAWKDF